MEKYELALCKAKRHVKFCAEIYEYQRENGRYFLHEHPWLATIWKMNCMLKLESHSDVQKVQIHMCRFGMLSRIGGVGSELGPVLKPTGFLTNAPLIAAELAKKCLGGHQHVNLLGGRASDAAIYPPGLCRAICRGLAAQLDKDKSGRGRSIDMCASGLWSCRERLLSIVDHCKQASGAVDVP